MISIETLKIKVKHFYIHKTCKIRREKINLSNFTIISNNCWGGLIYESYNLEKKSPTIGMFFMASDYIKFVNNIKEYLSYELKFIPPKESRWKEDLCYDKRFGSYPVAKLNDIEIFFLHYNSEEEAREKWKRRCKRINWDNLIIKFNDQNGCTKEDVINFLKLPYKNKLFFTCKNWNDSDKAIIKINQIIEKRHIMASNEPVGKSARLDMNKYINNIKK